MTKHIFVTGGVVSSLGRGLPAPRRHVVGATRAAGPQQSSIPLGKGLTSASIGMLLEQRGLRVRMQKLDPYINVDPGTMSPYQHGEVYVLDDGSETDLDLGHYERFTNSPLNRHSNYTTGQIYLSVIEKERRGEFLGQTVQVIPHITNEIKAALAKPAGPDVDVVITEIGGTVGDIESQPFLEAIRQFSLDVGKENCLYIHLTLVPYLKAAAELKTKPTQHSVGQLRQIGIQPDILVCRTERSLSRDDRAKIALFCNVPIEAVIEEKDKDFSVYEVPMSLVEHGHGRADRPQAGPEGRPAEPRPLARPVAPAPQPGARNHASPWWASTPSTATPTSRSTRPSTTPACITGRRSASSGSTARPSSAKGPNACWPAWTASSCPAGSASGASKARSTPSASPAQRGIPFFGICLGMQCAVAEFARNVLGLERANSTEFDKDTPHPVICLLDEQKTITDKGGTMRLGAQPTRLAPGSKAAACYGDAGHLRAAPAPLRVQQRLSPAVRRRRDAGSPGTSPDGALVEVVEIPDHPWFVGVQYHPEFKSQPTRSHPLFAGFVGAALRAPTWRSVVGLVDSG